MNSLWTQKPPKGWDLVKLGDIGKIASGITLGKKITKQSTRKVPYLRVANVKDGHLDLKSVYCIEATEKEIEKCRLQFGDLLLTEGGDPDKLGRGTFWSNQIPECIHQNHIFRIRFDLEKYCSEFIALQIGSSYGKSYFLAHAKQTTGIATINQQVLSNCPLVLPTLEEQRRIAAIARKCDRLRRTRRFTQQLSDTYLQSVFLEMFGDPLTNPKQWEIGKLSDLGILDRGVSKHRPRNYPKLLGGIYPLIQTGDVSNSQGYIKSYKQTYSQLGLEQSKIWPVGTLCITIAANIAKTGILTFDACFPDSVVGFTPNKKANIEFIQCWFSFLQKILEETAPESAQKNINLEILRSLDIMIPPMHLQEKFASVVSHHERLRAQQREAGRQAEHLFQTVLHRAFRGEL